MENVSLQIIDSKRYVKWRPYRYALYIACFLLFYMTIRPLGRPSISDYISVNNIFVYGLLLVLIIIGTVLYFYSKNYVILGELVIDEDIVTIQLNNKPSCVYQINNLEEFKISRGSTLHHEDEDRFPPETNDNWISYLYKNVSYKYEFCLDTIEKNAEFEKVIYALRVKYSTFYYESI
ncbi:MAG: hypothetical protein ABJC12_08125 [Saprospiraceae bacterium]